MYKSRYITTDKLGYQCPKNNRNRLFREIHIDTNIEAEYFKELLYCESHNFVYDFNTENYNLQNGLPCIFTDSRYKESVRGNCILDERRAFPKHLNIKDNKPLSLKACIRKTLKCRNIPVGYIVTFQNAYHSKKKTNFDYYFKIRKENNFNPNYQINKPEYFDNFTDCEFSIKLVNELRANGFIVGVHKESSFVIDEITKEKIHVSKVENIKSKIKNEYALAYGHNKAIAFSTHDDNLFDWYSNGRKNILWSFYGCHNKWSDANEFPKKEGIEAIINELVNFKLEDDYN